MMNRQQSGFTLIELVMVIVILGILAATALPKFVDLSSDARASAIKGLAGTLSSASSVNRAAMAVNTNNGVTIRNCSDVSNALAGGLPAGYSIAAAAVAANATVTCTLNTDPSTSLTATFVAHGTS